MKKPPVSLWTEIAKTRIQAAHLSEDNNSQGSTAGMKLGADALRIGDFFVNSGRLSQADISTIIEKQRIEKLRFGDAAIALGLLSEQEVQQALSKQYDYPIASADAALAGFPIAHAPHTPEAEAIRKIRTQLLLKLEPSELRCLAIISPNSGEGKSYVATSLALAFAQNGQRTLLINANLREAQHSGVLDSQRSQGLSSVLSQRGNITQAEVITLLTLDTAKDAKKALHALKSTSIQKQEAGMPSVLKDLPIVGERFLPEDLLPKQVVLRKEAHKLGEADLIAGCFRNGY